MFKTSIPWPFVPIGWTPPTPFGEEIHLSSCHINIHPRNQSLPFGPRNPRWVWILYVLVLGCERIWHQEGRGSKLRSCSATIASSSCSSSSSSSAGAVPDWLQIQPWLRANHQLPMIYGGPRMPVMLVQIPRAMEVILRKSNMLMVVRQWWSCGASFFRNRILDAMRLRQSVRQPIPALVAL